MLSRKKAKSSKITDMHLFFTVRNVENCGMHVYFFLFPLSLFTYSIEFKRTFNLYYLFKKI
jgi:hypothetical protein